MIYLDNAATTLIKPQAVSRAMVKAMNTMASPGRGSHRPAMLAADLLYKCRCLAAELFGAGSPEQVVFTMNATHGLNIAINSLLRPGMSVLISGAEHNSVTRPLKAGKANILVAKAPLFDPKAQIDAFKRRIDQAELVVCTHVSNVFGAVMPIEEIAESCRSRHIPLIIDASQSAGVLPIDLQSLGAAFIAMPGHKGLFGPQGTGLLLCHEAGRPLLYGGSGSDSIEQTMPDYLPDGLEAGTHNVCGIAGLMEGLKYVKEKGISSILAHEQMLLYTMIEELNDVEGLELFSGEMGFQTGVLSLRGKTISCEDVSEFLGDRGICVRSGLHCAPFAHHSAGTLPTGTVRFSFSPFNTPAQIRAACHALKELF